jgi:heme-degrading monooxygenase HmoA
LPCRRQAYVALVRRSTAVSETRPASAALSLVPASREFAMAEIQQNKGIVTQITTVKLPPDRQQEVLRLMTERAQFMAKQPGFVSISLHRSQDGSHVINYIQWSDAEKLKAAHHSPEFRKKWPEFGKIAEEIDPCLYNVVLSEAA